MWLFIIIPVYIFETVPVFCHLGGFFLDISDVQYPEKLGTVLPMASVYGLYY